MACFTLLEPYIGSMSERTPPEPEILPPERQTQERPERRWGDQRKDDSAPFWIWTSDGRGRRLYAGRLGPLGLIAIFAALALLGALGFFVFLGALAIVIPVIGVLVIGAIVAGILRRL